MKYRGLTYPEMYNLGKMSSYGVKKKQPCRLLVKFIKDFNPIP